MKLGSVTPAKTKKALSQEPLGLLYIIIFVFFQYDVCLYVMCKSIYKTRVQIETMT